MLLQLLVKIIYNYNLIIIIIFIFFQRIVLSSSEKEVTSLDGNIIYYIVVFAHLV